MKTILIVTTVPETLATILRSQPRFLASHFHVHLAAASGVEVDMVRESEGVEISCVEMVRGIAPLRDVRSIINMISLLREIKPDLVHSYTPKAGLITMLSAAICRVPVRIHTFTGLIFPSRRGLVRWILRAVDSLICACATVVVPEGRGVRNDLLVNDVTMKPLNLIGQGNVAGVDVEHFSPEDADTASRADIIRDKQGIPSDAFVFCYVGRLHSEKGINELVEAFTQLPARAHLLLVGRPDSTAPPSPRTAQIIASHPRIHALGFNLDVRPAMYCSDLVVLPSYREGFPNVLLEAGALGKATVASDINGCNEIIIDGVTGWLTQAKSVASLLVRMREAMLMPREALESVGRAARERVVAEFDRVGHRQRLLALYNQQLFNGANLR